ncbi:hypothetical protein F4780DRAFT_709979 [Xylariomycetidae sp. FL0641]|nr:hypothetical protein F4780DRAFT_709979 [Xylariomycetidae sp. FL0641]
MTPSTLASSEPISTMTDDDTAPQLPHRRTDDSTSTLVNAEEPVHEGRPPNEAPNPSANDESEILANVATPARPVAHPVPPEVATAPPEPPISRPADTPATPTCPSPQSSASDELPDDIETQDIPARHISRSLLKATLRNKFGVGGFKVSLMHNFYCIEAPEKLTMDEIAACTKLT